MLARLETMPYALRGEGEELADRLIPVEEVLLVGRGEGCDLIVKDPRLSRRHARFFVEGGRLMIEDLGSPNGTFVNQRRIKREQLVPGDRVTLGKTAFTVESLGAPRAAARDGAPGGEDAVDTAPELVKPVAEVLEPSLEGVLADPTLASLAGGHPTLLDVQPKVFERVARQTIHFAVLHEVSKLVQRREGARALLSGVLELVLRAVGGDRAYVALLDAEGRLVVEVVGHRGLSPAARGAVTISSTLARRVIGGRAGVISRDLAHDERFQGSASMALSDARSMLAVPILAPSLLGGESRALGLLGVESSALGRSFVEPDLDLLSVVCSTLGVALDNIRLAEAREETIRALREAQEKLIHAQEELVKSEQLAVIGRFATGIAHEVKNQLSPFMLAEMIARQYPDDARIRSAAEVMLEAQQHILDLVNELRAFAAGAEATHELEVHDLASVAEGVLRFMQCDAKLKKARRTSLQVSARPWVELNPRAMRQVLVNLLRNAADAVPPGRGEIVVEVRAVGDRALLDVRDNGPGIPADVAARIFEPFFSTKGEDGLGLGLDIARKIVRSLGGELSFQTTPDVGTVFTVSLPLRPPPA